MTVLEILKEKVCANESQKVASPPLMMMTACPVCVAMVQFLGCGVAALCDFDIEI